MTLLETISNAKLHVEKVKTLFYGYVCVYKGMREEKVLNTVISIHTLLLREIFK